MSAKRKMQTKKQLVLVDGSSYLFRAFHAMPYLTNPQGEPTGAIYGVVNMLQSLLAEYQPDYFGVIFDPKGKTFRDELYPDYKANRGEMPEDLAVQIAPLHAIIRALGLPLVVIEGYEADDVIGTLATQATANNLTTIISTGDKDLAQLVNEHVSLVNTMTQTVLDPVGVKEKFGVLPEQIIDYLALMGDKVDNIPGVPGVGPKTAVKWIEQYGSLDAVVAEAESIKGKIGERLREHIQDLPLSRKLVTIKCDIDLPIGPSDLVQQPYNRSELISLYRHLAFKTWLGKLLSEQTDAEPVDQAEGPQYEIINSQKQLHAWLVRLEKAELFAFDTETTSLDARSANVVGVSFAIKVGEAAYVPIAHTDDSIKQLSKTAVLMQLKPLLQDPTQYKVGHNLKYDAEVLKNEGIELQGIAFDTMLESYVLDSGARRHDLDTLALKYLGHNTIHYEDLTGKGQKQITFDQVPIDKAGPYASEDSDISLQLHQQLWPKIAKEQKLKEVITTIEIPLVPILARMEYQGVLVDSGMLNKQSKVLSQRIDSLKDELFSTVGESFNLDSPKQVGVVLFEKLKLPIIAKTATGQPSTAESVLQELALDYPLPKLILEYRSLQKLKTTYTDKLPEQINAATGRIHTSYHQAVTATGRLSSSEPNLQNIPIRTEAGRQIRCAFIAPKGCQLIAADYSQIELRIMAHLSEDKGLLEAFSNDHDIHQATASEVFGVALDAVSADQRRSAKAINFGLMYGMSAFGLAKQLDISKKQAQAYIDLYFARYPGVLSFMNNIRETALAQGYVETLYGRRLYLPEIRSQNRMRQMAAERMAINAPMQGTAADIIKRAMIRLDKVLQRVENTHMIMQVHDELIVEAPTQVVEEVMGLMTEAMTGAGSLNVPLKVSIGVGDNWEQAH